MVAANVCAAEELERLVQPCMYRVHDRPSDAKLEGLRQFLATLDITLPQRDRLHPRDFASVLAKVRGTPQERLVNEAVLRGQSQAAYAPDNLGHFGLALRALCAFHPPDPPLCRPAGPSRADPRAETGRGRAERDRGGPLRRDRRAHHGDRTPRRDGRARRGGPIPRCFMATARGRSVRGAHFRRDSLRAVRHGGAEWGERDRPAPISAGRSMGLGRGHAIAGRSQDEADLHPGPGRRGASRGSDAADRRHGVPPDAGHAPTAGAARRAVRSAAARR